MAFLSQEGHVYALFPAEKRNIMPASSLKDKSDLLKPHAIRNTFPECRKIKCQFVCDSVRVKLLKLYPSKIDGPIIRKNVREVIWHTNSSFQLLTGAYI